MFNAYGPEFHTRISGQLLHISRHCCHTLDGYKVFCNHHHLLDGTLETDCHKSIGLYPTIRCYRTLSQLVILCRDVTKGTLCRKNIISGLHIASSRRHCAGHFETKIRCLAQVLTELTEFCH